MPPGRRLPDCRAPPPDACSKFTSEKISGPAGRSRSENLDFRGEDRDDDDYETEPRMAVYVLGAKEFYRRGADVISTGLVILKTGATKPYAFFEE